MHMHHAAFARSTAVRASLKRGLARQTLTEAQRESADLPTLFGLAAGLRPNPKGVERTGARLKSRPGVARVTLSPCRRSLTVTTRTLQDIDARVQGETAFHETGLIYLRVRIDMKGGRLGFGLSAVGFCRHAVERLVERSSLPLDVPLLPALDAEAQAVFRNWDSATRIMDDGDEFYGAAVPGVWAGGYDAMKADADWGLAGGNEPLIPIFSARTFLSPAEMRPTVFLRWKDDPTCRMV